MDGQPAVHAPDGAENIVKILHQRAGDFSPKAANASSRFVQTVRADDRPQVGCVFIHQTSAGPADQVGNLKEEGADGTFDRTVEIAASESVPVDAGGADRRPHTEPVEPEFPVDRRKLRRIAPGGAPILDPELHAAPFSCIRARTVSTISTTKGKYLSRAHS